MIKFFRHIRKTLISENKMGKYFKYAIGEIILVVIGILIALSINNWNENRKVNTIAKQYLTGIKEDLKKDLVQIDSLINLHKIEFSIISSIDSVFHKNNIYNTNNNLFEKPDTLNFAALFYRNTSFRSISGSYNSLIADGKTGLIKNKLLFQEIQQIYEEKQKRLESTYEVTKVIEQNISWAYSYEKYKWTYYDLKKAKNEKIFSDLVNFTEQKYFYIQNLIRVKDNSKKVINLIDQELNND